MVEMRFNLHAVWFSVDEARHGCRAKGNAIVVEIFAVDTLHHIASVLFTGRFHLGFKRPVTTLLGRGLIGTIETVLGRNDWP